MQFGRRAVLAGLMGTAWLATSAFGPEAKKITLALPQGDAALWEISAMQAAGLDKYNNIEVEIREVADSQAGQAALQAGEVDAILSDFVWVSSQRNQGADFAIVAHSLAMGGLIAPAGGAVKSVADLEGKTLAVAGEPADASFAVLQAYFNFRTGKPLTDVATVEFGPPAQVTDMLANGQAQAALNDWQSAARARLAGAVDVVSLWDMLAEMGVARQPPLLGWTFSEKVARKKKEDVKRFLEASFATREKLLADDALWDQIRPMMPGAEDDALFAALRDAYRAGIVTGYGKEDAQAAAEAHALIAPLATLPDLAKGTFWGGYSK